MARKVDERKTRRALTKLRKAVDSAEQTDGAELSEWEKGFAASVEQRLETYGSAFTSAEKGNLEDAVSRRQDAKIKEIAKKARTARKSSKAGAAAKPKARKPMSRGKTKRAPRSRDIYDDMKDVEVETPPAAPPKLTVIKGGRKDEA